jgi:hypothetical protein
MAVIRFGSHRDRPKIHQDLSRATPRSTGARAAAVPMQQWTSLHLVADIVNAHRLRNHYQHSQTSAIHANVCPRSCGGMLRTSPSPSSTVDVHWLGSLCSSQGSPNLASTADRRTISFAPGRTLRVRMAMSASRAMPTLNRAENIDSPHSTRRSAISLPRSSNSVAAARDLALDPGRHRRTPIHVKVDQRPVHHSDIRAPS